MDFKIVKIPQPYFEPTNVVRIGDTIIDVGHLADISTSLLVEHLESGELTGVREVIITHPHIDHVGASAVLAALADKPHIVHKGADHIVQDYMKYIMQVREEEEELIVYQDNELVREMLREMDRTYFPTDREYHIVNISRVVESGDEIHIGQVTLKVIYTPGHEVNHMALFHEDSGTLFTGDLIANKPHFRWAPLTASIGDYERSLRAVLDVRPKLIVPCHGELIEDPVEHLNECIASVDEVKTKILGMLESHEEALWSEITRVVFNVEDFFKVGNLSLVTLAFLHRLEEEGKVIVDKDYHTASRIR